MKQDVLSFPRGCIWNCSIFLSSVLAYYDEADLKANWCLDGWAMTEPMLLVKLYSPISEENITVAFWTKHRQETQFMKTLSYRENLHILRFKGGKHAVSSPGWRSWTACFVLCVSWPATSCSRRAMQRPGRRGSVSSDGEPEPGCLQPLIWSPVCFTVRNL